MNSQYQLQAEGVVFDYAGEVLDTYTGEEDTPFLSIANKIVNIHTIVDGSDIAIIGIYYLKVGNDEFIFEKESGNVDSFTDLQTLYPDKHIGVYIEGEVDRAGQPEFFTIALSKLDVSNNIFVINAVNNALTKEEIQYLNNIYTDRLIHICIADAKSFKVVAIKPDFISNSKGMHLVDFIGFIHITEKFRLADLLFKGVLKNEIDEISPVYKSLYDVFLGSDSNAYPYNGDNDKVPIKDFYHLGLPTFRTLFDWTSPTTRRISIDEEAIQGADTLGEAWPIQVQIRIQLVEPQGDTISPIGSRRYLRGGNIQFLISTGQEIEVDGIPRGRPLSELARVAQYYVDKYGSNKGTEIIRGIPTLEKDLKSGSSIHIGQFENTTEDNRRAIFTKLFPEADFSVPTIWPTLFSRINSLQFFVANVANLRFAPVDRPNVTQRSLLDPKYGLGVTIPFTYEQQK